MSLDFYQVTLKPGHLIQKVKGGSILTFYAESIGHIYKGSACIPVDLVNRLSDFYPEIQGICLETESFRC